LKEGLGEILIIKKRIVITRQSLLPIIVQGEILIIKKRIVITTTQSFYLTLNLIP